MATKIKPSNLDFTTLNIAVSNTGNVGIGTSSPAEELHVQAGAPTLRLQDIDDNAYTNMVHNAGGFRIDVDPTQAGTNSFFRVDVDFTERMRIDSAGNVGIGTSSPAQLLHLVGGNILIGIDSGDSFNSQARLRIQGAGSEYIQIKGDGTGQLGLLFGDDSDNFLAGVLSDQGSGNDLRFNAANAERMRIDSSGNVGIGTTSPATKLAVSGGALRIDAGDAIEDALVIGAGTSGTTGEIRSVKIFANSSTVKGIQLRAENAVQKIVSLNGGGIGQLAFGNSSDGGTTFNERMRIDASGNVGIGTTSPDRPLKIEGSNAGRFTAAAFYNNVNSADTTTSIEFLDRNIVSGGTSAVRLSSSREASSSAFAFSIETADAGTYTERMRITSAGNVGIGTTAPATKLEIASDVPGDNFIRLNMNADPNAYFGAPIGKIQMNWIGDPNWASINFEDERAGAGGTHRSGISFTTRDGNNAGAERMRITSAGAILVGATSISTTSDTDTGFSVSASGTGTFARSGNFAIVAMRQTNDGTIISLRQAGVEEGTISVSGTTVSYNGGHLSRWAQFPDNSRPELLKGTVMSNLDQMSNWDNEENEQLNCVQVSTVEGDANVAGVFVTWDSTDDGYNDILLAMTGDMVIRIGAGVTVARGDLLMSAGDGTAKPQGDDIVRSKTIAKVTSIHVSHTYADGSYAIPCVLMAC